MPDGNIRFTEHVHAVNRDIVTDVDKIVYYDATYSSYIMLACMMRFIYGYTGS